MMDLSQITWRKARGSANNGSCVEIAIWRESSPSTQQGNCVDVTGTWRPNGHSTGDDTACVKIATVEAVVLTRDSKDPNGPVLGFDTDTWVTFLNTVKSGRLDLH